MKKLKKGTKVIDTWGDPRVATVDFDKGNGTVYLKYPKMSGLYTALREHLQVVDKVTA